MWSVDMLSGIIPEILPRIKQELAISELAGRWEVFLWLGTAENRPCHHQEIGACQGWFYCHNSQQQLQEWFSLILHNLVVNGTLAGAAPWRGAVGFVAKKYAATAKGIVIN